MTMQQTSVLFGNTISGAPELTIPGILSRYDKDLFVRSTGTKFSITDVDKNDIVSIDNYGNVIWPKGINITEAAKAFEEAIKIGAEMKAGITEKVKINIRNSLFDYLLSAAEEKGSLTFEEIKMLYTGAKMFDVLQGKY